MKSSSAARRKRRSRRDAFPVAMPSVTSLMDVVTILLVYFIKVFAVNPVTVQDPSLHLPISSAAETVEQAVVIMVSGQSRQDVNAQEKVVNVKEMPTIFVDDKPVAQLDFSSYRVPGNLKSKGYVITPLRNALAQIRQNQMETAKISGDKGFTGHVIIVADKNTPYSVLTDILVTSSDAGFDKFKFAIVKNHG